MQNRSVMCFYHQIWVCSSVLKFPSQLPNFYNHLKTPHWKNFYHFSQHISSVQFLKKTCPTTVSHLLTPLVPHLHPFHFSFELKKKIFLFSGTTWIDSPDTILRKMNLRNSDLSGLCVLVWSFFLKLYILWYSGLCRVMPSGISLPRVPSAFVPIVSSTF